MPHESQAKKDSVHEIRSSEKFTRASAAIPRRLLRPGDDEYDGARGIWNGMVARKPGLIARCADVTDVQIAVRAAAGAGVVTAVRCGGHSLAGFSTCDDGLVIDLFRMRAVRVDAQTRVRD